MSGVEGSSSGLEEWSSAAHRDSHGGLGGLHHV